MNIRAQAARVIFDVLENERSLADVLPPALTKFNDARDKALLQAICYGVCRWYFRLDAMAKQLLEKPLKAKDQDIYALLLVGLFQLMDMRIPDYAAVTETVAATKHFKKIWAKGLVNGVLRQYQRQIASLNLSDQEEVFYSHPDWFIQKVKQDFPADWQMILQANNQHPPLALRVNRLHSSREDYLKRLSIAAKEIPDTQSGIVLEDAMDVQLLPGFNKGDVSVQDGAAQLAAELLLLEPDQRVLDACAAPGGKTTHILELAPSTTCIAVEQNEARLLSVTENLERLKLNAQCICADVGEVEKWWDGQLFDRILLDAPCSASGVIRRHPDIKLLRQVSDIKALVSTQERLLRAVWPLLKPGGILLYVTCSIFPEENALLIQDFIKEYPDAAEDKISASWGQDCIIGKQILPGVNGMDGFYFARLRK